MIYYVDSNDFERFHRGLGVGHLEVRVCGIEIIAFFSGNPWVDAGGLRSVLLHTTEQGDYPLVN